MSLSLLAHDMDKKRAEDGLSTFCPDTGSLAAPVALLETLKKLSLFKRSMQKAFPEKTPVFLSQTVISI